MSSPLVRRLTFLFALVLAVLMGVWAIDRYWPGPNSPIRIACVGDSVTFGSGVADRANESYPAQLSKLLGSGWNVGNFGANDTTVLRIGDKPYIKKRAFKLARRFKPHIVIIELGLNDTKPQNWAYKASFVEDYVHLIRMFQGLASHPRILLCLPTPVFPNETLDDAVIKNELIPLIEKVAHQTGLVSVNLYTVLQGKRELFFDPMHPNNKGYANIAQSVAMSIKRADVSKNLLR